MENEAFGGAHREGGLRVCVCLRVCVGGGGLHTGVLHTALFFFLDGPS